MHCVNCWAVLHGEFSHTKFTSYGHQDLEEKHGSCEGMIKHHGGFDHGNVETCPCFCLSLLLFHGGDSRWTISLEGFCWSFGSHRAAVR